MENLRPGRKLKEKPDRVLDWERAKGSARYSLGNVASVIEETISLV